MAMEPLKVPTDDAAPALTKRRGRGVAADSTNWRGAIIFLAPASVLLLVFLVYPTIYSIALSFNRGRRGEFTEMMVVMPGSSRI